MKKINRRNFLESCLTVAAAASLPQIISACSPKQIGSDSPPPTPSAESIFPSLTIKTPQPESITQTGTPDLMVTRGGDPEVLVERAINALGGMQRFVSPGDSVVIKPNICVAYHTYEFAATTNPWVVGELVKLCVAAGAARVMVMDFPFGGSCEQAYVTSGIQQQVTESGGSMIPMDGSRFKAIELSEAIFLKRAEVFEEVLNADILINVPIAKHHGSARLTLGMKNLMGIVRDRPAMHSNLNQSIADLANHIRPSLTVIDAVRILTRNGPSGGDLADVKQLDTIIASRDIVAADAYASTLFGLKPDSLNYVRMAVKHGLGTADLSQIKIEEISV